MPVKNYRSIEDLQAQAKINSEMERQIAERKPDFIYKNAVKLYDAGMKEKRKGNTEMAYILIFKSVSLCNLFTRSIASQNLSNSLDGRVFHNFYDKALREIEELTAFLKKSFENQNSENRNPIPTHQVPIIDPVQKPKDQLENFGRSIRPQDLVNLVEKHNKRALVLDYRPNAIPGIDYKNPENIRVVSISIRLISPELDFQHLIMYTEPLVRDYINKIGSYDVVVLLGDDLESGRREFGSNTKTGIFVEALTKYSNRYPLKHPPIWLEGGFPAWKNAYPIYVKDPDFANLDYLGDGDGVSELSRHLQMMRKTAIIFKYPELSSLTSDLPMLKPRSSSPQTRDVTTPPNASQSETTQPETIVQDQSKDFSSSETTITSLVQPTVTPKPKPLIDRSNKPTEGKADETTTTQFPISNDKAPVAVPPIPSRTPGTVGKSQPIIPPTLGGARVDMPPTAPTRLPQNQGARPEIPPRIPKTQNPVYAQYYENVDKVYMITRQNIYNSNYSRRGRVDRGCTGLRNLHNTCYMNCVLQALIHTPQMKEIFSNRNYEKFLNPDAIGKTQGTIVASFGALMDAAWSGDFISICPGSFWDTFTSMVNPGMRDKDQHDAREFLMSLLDAMHDDMNNVSKNARSPFVQDFDGTNILSQAATYEMEYTKRWASSQIMNIFYLRTVSKIPCNQCRMQSVTFEETPQVILELVDGNMPRLDHCLASHYDDTPLDGAWTCEKCKYQQRTKRSTKIWKLPEVLVICLKRFAQNNADLYKNNTEIQIGDIDMKNYLDPQSPETLSRKTKYELYAITYHFGQLNAGHYTSVVRSERGPWLNFDDHTVTFKDCPQSSNAFILYYKRV
ncbi:Ubiquitin carboxyl-terminal hydrolase [Aphelenchoides besseyi]|nr:Ubiquitin carboxyl-terminal hydrolase [Aphelenchoides besseyi]